MSYFRRNRRSTNWKGMGLPSFVATASPSRNHIVGGGCGELRNHIGEGVRHLLQLPGVDPDLVPSLVELDPGPVVLVLSGHLPMLLDHIRDRSLLGEHHLNRPEDLDMDCGEGFFPLTREACHLPEIVHGLVGMIDLRGIQGEGLRNRVPDVPFADTDPAAPPG